jgi:DNA-binding transcriptional MerR regulator
MKEDIIKEGKIFYRISEIAELFDVKVSLLRFWEKEFSQITPKTNARGVRLYRKEDIDTIGLIYHLVKERGMTLEGARRVLKENKENVARNYEIVLRLQNVKKELLALIDELQ